MRTSNLRAPAVTDDASQQPSTHDLLNDATMWLQYARGVTVVLADLVHESEDLDGKQLSLALEAIAAMTRLGIQQLADARANGHWEVACLTGSPRS